MRSPVPTSDPAFPGQFLALAEQVCRRYFAEFPDHVERYGERGEAFCAHDNAYLVAWLVQALELDARELFVSNVRWLRDVLLARNFPAAAFERNLELVAEVVSAERPQDGQRIEALLTDASA